MSYYLNRTVDLSFDRAMDPVGAMGAIDNPRLKVVAEQAREKLKSVVESI